MTHQPMPNAIDDRPSKTAVLTVRHQFSQLLQAFFFRRRWIYLPEFRNLRVAVDLAQGLESRPAEKTMTIRHLITNSSGLGNWTPASDSGDVLHKLYRERGITPGNVGAGLKRQDKLGHHPGPQETWCRPGNTARRKS